MKPKKKKSKKKKRYLYRSAVTGKLVPQWYAELHPKTTTREVVK